MGLDQTRGSKDRCTGCGQEGEDEDDDDRDDDEGDDEQGVWLAC